MRVFLTVRSFARACIYLIIVSFALFYSLRNIPNSTWHRNSNIYPKCTKISAKIKRTDTSNARRVVDINANFSAARVRLTSPLFFDHVLSFSIALPALLTTPPSFDVRIFTILRVEKFAFFQRTSQRDCALSTRHFLLFFLHHKFLSKLQHALRGWEFLLK